MNNEKKEVLKKISDIKGDEVKLYSFLYDLFYEEISTDRSFLESIYASFLSDPREDIKRVSIKSLLFGLKIKKDSYMKIAIDMSKNILTNFDLRLTSLSSLAEAYMGTRDKRILSLFYNIYKSEFEDEDLKTQSFIGLMKLLGLNSAEIFAKNNNIVIIGIDDISEKEFIEELNQVKSII